MKRENQLPRTAPVGFPVLLATLGLSLLALALPLVLLQVFDRVIPNNSHATLDVLFLGLLVVLVLDFAFKVCRSVILGAQGQAYEVALTRAAVGRILQADPEVFGQGRAGSHVDRQEAIATLRDFGSGQARLLHIDIPFTCLFIGMIHLIGGWLVLVPLGCVAALLIFRAVMRRAQAPALGERRAVNERRYSFLHEFLSQIVTVKALGMEQQMLRRYELLQDQSVEANRKLTIVAQVSQSFGAVLSQAAVAAMALLGGYLAMVGTIGIAELAACMLLNGRTIQPMLKLLGIWVQVEAVGESRRQLSDLFEMPQRTARRPSLPMRGAIALRDIRVPMDEGGTTAALSLDLAPGETLAIPDGDGVARAALFQILLGERAPVSGEALLDDLPVRTTLEARGRDALVYVDSQPVIFDGSILENLSLFGDGMAQKDVRTVARAIGLEDDIHLLPLGYDTHLSSQTGLTKGWLQRISLTRALALKPRVLLLDEPNTALDHRSESAILAQLRLLKGTTTMVIASPRPSWLALADHTLYLAAPRPDVEEWRAALTENDDDPVLDQRLIA